MTILIPGTDYEVAVCDNCGKDVHTVAELEDCLASMLGPINLEEM